MGLKTKYEILINLFIIFFYADICKAAQNQRVVDSRIQVFGLSEQNMLDYDGDSSGTVCSSLHRHGDFSNRWCHAIFIKAVDKYLSQSVDRKLSVSVSSLIFVVKEYVFDKKPSLSDMAIVEYNNITIFGDGAVFLNFSVDF